MDEIMFSQEDVNSIINPFNFSKYYSHAISTTQHERLLAAVTSSVAARYLILNYSEENLKFFFDALNNLFTDKTFSEVQIMILQRCKDIFIESKQCCKHYNQITKQITQLIISCLYGISEVQTIAVEVLSNLFNDKLFSQDVIMETLVPLLFKYLFNFKVWYEKYESAIEQYFLSRVDIVSILAKIANVISCYPRKWALEEFVPRFTKLSIDKYLPIRKDSIASFGFLAESFGEDFIEEYLIPQLEKVVKDENYQIRKLCCNLIVILSQHSSRELRFKVLTKHFLRLLNDPDKAVYETAIYQLGPFIATFADPNKTGVKLHNGQFTQLKTVKSFALKNEDNFSNTKDFNNDGYVEKKLTRFSSTDNLTNLSLYDNDFNDKKLCLYNYYEEKDEYTKENQNDFAIKNESMDVNNIDKVAENNILINDETLNDKDKTTTDKNYFNVFYWSFNNFSFDDDINNYCLHKKITKSQNDIILKKNKNVNIDDNVLDQKYDFFNKNDYDTKLLNDTELFSENNLLFSDNYKISVCNEKKSYFKNLNSYDKSNLFCDNVENTETSNYWQKRLDLLHRSVQSVVNNSSNAFAATASMLPSLKKFSLDSINKNKTDQSVLTQEFAVKSSALRGKFNSQQHLRYQLSPKRVLSSVFEDEQNESSKIKTKSFSSSRFTVLPGQDFSVNKDFQKPSNNLNLTKNENDQLSEFSTYNETKNLPCLNIPRFKIPNVLDNQHLTISTRMLTHENGERILTKDQRGNYANDYLSNKIIKNNINQQEQMRGNNFLSENMVLENQVLLNNRCHIQRELIRNSIDRFRRFFSEKELEFLKRSKQDVIPQELWDSLKGEITNVVDPNVMEVTRLIAHNIPAIVFTFGNAKWIFIKGLYLLLADYHQVEVRECIAQSLHEVAAIIGTANADRDLLPIFFKFLGDAPKVQYGLLKHLDDFCKVLSLPCREQLAQRLSLFVTVDGTRSYRLRAEFAERLMALVQLFSPQQINQYLSAFALTFSTDRIAEVRNNGINFLAEILGLFIRKEWIYYIDKLENNKDGTCTLNSIILPLTDSLLNEIRAGFWRTRNWRRRQSFGRMLEILLRKNLISEEQFVSIFYNDLMHVSEDEVPNVRQYFCSICQLAKENDFFCVDRSVSISVKSRLREMVEEDSDLEIRHQAQIALGELNTKTAELDLGKREIILLEASESLYKLVRQNFLLYQTIKSSNASNESSFYYELQNSNPIYAGQSINYNTCSKNSIFTVDEQPTVSQQINEVNNKNIPNTTINNENNLIENLISPTFDEQQTINEFDSINKTNLSCYDKKAILKLNLINDQKIASTFDKQSVDPEFNLAGKDEILRLNLSDKQNENLSNTFSTSKNNYGFLKSSITFNNIDKEIKDLVNDILEKTLQEINNCKKLDLN